MPSKRQRRVAELIHKEVSNRLLFNTHDPRIGFVTVTSVEITPDLKTATIYVSLLDGDETEVLAGLESATSFFRRELGRKIKLRYTPVLQFKLDQSLVYGEQIEALLSQIDIPSETDTNLNEDE